MTEHSHSHGRQRRCWLIGHLKVVFVTQLFLPKFLMFFLAFIEFLSTDIILALYLFIYLLPTVGEQGTWHMQSLRTKENKIAWTCSERAYQRSNHGKGMKIRYPITWLNATSCPHILSIALLFTNTSCVILPRQSFEKSCRVYWARAKLRNFSWKSIIYKEKRILRVICKNVYIYIFKLLRWLLKF